MKQELSSCGSSEVQPGTVSRREVSNREAVSVCIGCTASNGWLPRPATLGYAVDDKFSIPLLSRADWNGGLSYFVAFASTGYRPALIVRRCEGVARLFTRSVTWPNSFAVVVWATKRRAIDMPSNCGRLIRRYALLFADLGKAKCEAP